MLDDPTFRKAFRTFGVTLWWCGETLIRLLGGVWPFLSHKIAASWKPLTVNRDKKQPQIHPSYKRNKERMTALAVPDEFICPLTLEIMQCPVMTKTGFNYEKKAIMDWLQTKQVCPLTRQPLSISKVISNAYLQEKISVWAEENNVELGEIIKGDDEDNDDGGGDRYIPPILLMSVQAKSEVSKISEVNEENDTIPRPRRVSLSFFRRRRAGRGLG